ncbi:BZ3500_MvSof-1268-A1-R1_Chr1-3g02136 [Microbotryum saponariae]|uniref:BZ3500_MvSof-1268-A1-R1_Chr1-3g02136 protein n=1 Tax=Microbotryum saponariae TaxID=289078 RepID=A0A2X0LHF6_9BASI|nr:BZ3500_MvSof-1268-A1-R1_Chr1-3g02136 [Microbotryum saponariae]SCZ95483.1 BZ3501_MvSof-1269-A2-R1_Chr1-3g01738 [Microbotryum saponariae]
MTPLMDVRVFEPLASSLTNQTPGYSFHGRQTSDTLARPLDAWRDNYLRGDIEDQRLIVRAPEVMPSLLVEEQLPPQ